MRKATLLEPREGEREREKEGERERARERDREERERERERLSSMLRKLSSFRLRMYLNENVANINP